MRTPDVASNGLQSEIAYDEPSLHDTGGIRPLTRFVGNFVITAALSAGALGAARLASTTPLVPEAAIVVATVSSRLRTPKTVGQLYVSGRLDAMRDSSEDPHVRVEYPTYPSATAIDTARRLMDTLITDATPTPSVVPGDGDGGVVDFIWYKSGWDLVLSVGDVGAEVWARHRATGQTEVHGDRPEDYWQFVEILASLPTH